MVHFHSYQYFLLQRKYRILSDHLWTDVYSIPTEYLMFATHFESLFFRELSLSVERANRRAIFFGRILWKFGRSCDIFFLCICKLYLWKLMSWLYFKIFVFLASILNSLNSWKQAFRFHGVPRRMLFSCCNWIWWICDVNRF